MKGVIVGYGRHGKRFLKASLSISGFEIKGVYDVNKDVFDFKYGVKYFDKIETLIIECSPDLAVIASTGPSHFEIAKKLIGLGVRKLIISKPITTSFDQALKLKILIKKTKTVVAVDHGLRYDKTYNWIKKKLDSKMWGNILQINIQRSGIGLGCLGTHSFDLSNFLYNDSPRYVNAWVDSAKNANPRGKEFVDPGGLVVLKYKNEKKSVITQIESTIKGIFNVQIYCEKAVLNIDVKKKEFIIEKLDNNGNRTYITNPHEIEVKHDTVDLMKKIIENIINDEDNIIADYSHGINALKVLIGAYASNDSNNKQFEITNKKLKKFDRNLPVT